MVKIFIWNFVADVVLGQIMEWAYKQIVGFLSYFFGVIGEMGANLFNMQWVHAIITLFLYFGWALFIVGLVAAIFEYAIEAQTGRGDIKNTAINILKGLIAVNLFTIVPIELYKLSVSLQGTFSWEIAHIVGDGVSIGDIATKALASVTSLNMNLLMCIFYLVIMGYAVIKILFANIKRGGILLIQICVGSLYMFSIPRGYMDGFTSWCKQVIGICFTAFLQATILIAGLLTFTDDMMLGIGLILSASEIPRIAGNFGLDTSTKGNLMGAMYAVNGAMNMSRTVLQAVR